MKKTESTCDHYIGGPMDVFDNYSVMVSHESLAGRQ